MSSYRGPCSQKQAHNQLQGQQIVPRCRLPACWREICRRRSNRLFLVIGDVITSPPAPLRRGHAAHNSHAEHGRVERRQCGRSTPPARRRFRSASASQPHWPRNDDVMAVWRPGRLPSPGHHRRMNRSTACGPLAVEQVVGRKPTSSINRRGRPAGNREPCYRSGPGPGPVSASPDGEACGWRERSNWPNAAGLGFRRRPAIRRRAHSSGGRWGSSAAWCRTTTVQADKNRLPDRAPGVRRQISPGDEVAQLRGGHQQIAAGMIEQQGGSRGVLEPEHGLVHARYLRRHQVRPAAVTGR